MRRLAILDIGALLRSGGKSEQGWKAKGYELTLDLACRTPPRMNKLLS